MLAILQLDAASTTLLDRLVSEGRMPTVAELRKRALRVSLGTASTGRLSPAAHYWTLYTGVPAREHGLTSRSCGRRERNGSGRRAHFRSRSPSGRGRWGAADAASSSTRTSWRSRSQSTASTSAGGSIETASPAVRRRCRPVSVTGSPPVSALRLWPKRYSGLHRRSGSRSSPVGSRRRRVVRQQPSRRCSLVTSSTSCGSPSARFTWAVTSSGTHRLSCPRRRLAAASAGAGRGAGTASTRLSTRRSESCSRSCRPEPTSSCRPPWAWRTRRLAPTSCPACSPACSTVPARARLRPGIWRLRAAVPVGARAAIAGAPARPFRARADGTARGSPRLELDARIRAPVRPRRLRAPQPAGARARRRRRPRRCRRADRADRAGLPTYCDPDGASCVERVERCDGAELSTGRHAGRDRALAADAERTDPTPRLTEVRRGGSDRRRDRQVGRPRARRVGARAPGTLRICATARPTLTDIAATAYAALGGSPGELVGRSLLAPP